MIKFSGVSDLRLYECDPEGFWTQLFLFKKVRLFYVRNISHPINKEGRTGRMKTIKEAIVVHEKISLF